MGLQSWVCVVCQHVSQGYTTHCPACKGLHTLGALASESVSPARRAKKASLLSVSPLRRVSLGNRALDLVLGGGLVVPSSVLVSGEAGVGKSTAILKAAVYLSSVGVRVLYGSAEMPETLLAHVLRGRLNVNNKDIDNLYITETERIEDVLYDLRSVKPSVLVLDSMQRYRHREETGLVALGRVVADAQLACRLAEASLILISQVTKDDDFAGQNSIRHDVDVDLSIERDKKGDTYACVRTKNRYGQTPVTELLNA